MSTLMLLKPRLQSAFTGVYEVATHETCILEWKRHGFYSVLC